MFRTVVRIWNSAFFKWERVHYVFILKGWLWRAPRPPKRPLLKGEEEQRRRSWGQSSPSFPSGSHLKKKENVMTFIKYIYTYTGHNLNGICTYLEDRRTSRRRLKILRPENLLIEKKLIRSFACNRENDLSRLVYAKESKMGLKFADYRALERGRNKNKKVFTSTGRILPRKTYFLARTF